jgi:hypothetical protein
MPPTRTIGQGADAYTEVLKNFTGIPKHLAQGIRRVITQEKNADPKVKSGEIYAVVLRDIIAAHRKGEPIVWLGQMTPGPAARPAQVWIKEDVSTEFERFCAEIQRPQGVVLITALDRYLHRRTGGRP